MSGDKNPKHAAGRAKPSLRFTPLHGLWLAGEVMKGGAEKYGPFNWREGGVVASVYYDAALRHLTAWYEGEDKDPDSGLPHPAHVIANMLILLDCEQRSKVEDDRPRQ